MPVRYNRCMRFKTGLLIGLATGYYLGARAGRERYEEIESVLERARATDAYAQARARVDAIVGDVAVNARQVLADRVPGRGDAPGPSGYEANAIDDTDELEIPAGWFDDEPTA